MSPWQKVSLLFSRLFIGLVSCLLCFTFIHTPVAIALNSQASWRDSLPAINQPAPDFQLPTNEGDRLISLEDYRGKWLVLYFYPADFTPGCTIEARRFQKDLPKYLAKNTQVIGISADDVQSHQEFCDSEGLKFPLLADVNGTVSQSYGSWMKPYSLRHTFIIDPEGIVKQIFLRVQPSVHSEEVLESLQDLQSQYS